MRVVVGAVLAASLTSSQPTYDVRRRHEVGVCYSELYHEQLAYQLGALESEISTMRRRLENINLSGPTTSSCGNCDSSLLEDVGGRLEVLRGEVVRLTNGISQLTRRIENVLSATTTPISRSCDCSHELERLRDGQNSMRNEVGDLRGLLEEFLASPPRTAGPPPPVRPTRPTVSPGMRFSIITVCHLLTDRVAGIVVLCANGYVRLSVQLCISYFASSL